MSPVNLDRYAKTEKQRQYTHGPPKGAADYETWDEIQVGKEYTSPIKYNVKVEDIKVFAEGVLTPNPCSTMKRRQGPDPLADCGPPGLPGPGRLLVPGRGTGQLDKHSRCA